MRLSVFLTNASLFIFSCALKEIQLCMKGFTVLKMTFLWGKRKDKTMKKQPWRTLWIIPFQDVHCTSPSLIRGLKDTLWQRWRKKIYIHGLFQVKTRLKMGLGNKSLWDTANSFSHQIINTVCCTPAGFVMFMNACVLESSVTQPLRQFCSFTAQSYKVYQRVGKILN